MMRALRMRTSDAVVRIALCFLAGRVPGAHVRDRSPPGRIAIEQAMVLQGLPELEEYPRHGSRILTLPPGSNSSGFV
jgi:hypothetical protein